MTLDDQYMNNLTSQTEGLIGGMALPNGMLFMSTHGVGVGYHDKEGQLHSISRPLNPALMRRVGVVGGLLWMFVEWSMMLLSRLVGVPNKEDRKIMLVGFATGALVSMIAILNDPDFWKLFYLSFLALAALAVLLIPGLRYHLQEMRRYHGAEHQLLHAVGLGETPSQESLARQTVFHPLCGTTAMMPLLPLAFVGPFLPWWGHLLAWPLVFLALFGAAIASKEGDRRAWARLWMRVGEWGQGFTTAPTEARHREAAVAAWEALRACYPQVGKMQAETAS
ncbi:DUF1385 domain-containing protein [Meiothermus sp. CFH 77666]|uniref:DUF1385 domain-containing protein n=1 Tax=Meiothermus sp. CFH 77666 TaxID=2817942 RepID=UPI001AA00E7D|nr:DUF1385 domain-containing protein [Meiothermus sp. CFH 77666]MBO1438441.1 DUF1385 domain-containing protein [Meiothermus sp. CFH 77666]